MKNETLKKLQEAQQNYPDAPPDIKALFQTAIERQEANSALAAKDIIANSLNTISKVIAQAQVARAGATQDEIESMVKSQLAKAKIGLSNLDASITSLLSNVATQTTLTIQSPIGLVTKNVTIDPKFLLRPLTQLMLSDVAAKNNCYLYGGAGTGKTYSASELARLLGWGLVEVNCNQFTSPLDLLGGQTISGYQEGLVVQAWSNKIDGKDYDGVVLLLDELPKIDPNTAGILNSALAKVKLSGDRSKITNGRGQKFEKKNVFIVATGNVKLNETSEDYEANFKQDLSLQDRFVGSTYPIFVYYNTEVEETMRGFLFIWLYMVKLRQFIERKRLQSRGFVSIRIMESLRDTYRVYRTYESKLVVGGDSLIKQPKTLEQAVESFFSLFPENVVRDMKQETDYDTFIQIIKGKNNMPFTSEDTMNFDTDFERTTAMEIAQRNDSEKNKIYQTT